MKINVTRLKYSNKKIDKQIVDWDSFVVPSERGKNVDEYMREMRGDDRINNVFIDTAPLRGIIRG